MDQAACGETQRVRDREKRGCAWKKNKREKRANKIKTERGWICGKKKKREKRVPEEKKNAHDVTALIETRGKGRERKERGGKITCCLSFPHEYFLQRQVM